MTRHLIDDYGHTTQTRPAMITDEWGTEHLPLTQVALAAAVPIIEAEVRERIARDIEAAQFDLSGDIWVDGDLVIDGRTYRLTKQIVQTVNAVRLSDAAIARGTR